MIGLDMQRYEEAVRSLYRDVASVAGEVYQTRQLLGLVRWAEEHYELPPDSAFRGKFRLARAPYLRRPMECLEDPRVKQLVVAKGSQLFFTTIAQIWKGWGIDEDPASMICVWPSEYMLKRYVITRINPMLEDCEPLRRVFQRSGLRDSDDSMKYKGFPGGGISFVTGRSSGQLKSITAQRMHVSELDELEDDVSGQGDPLDQARRAMRTHPRGKEYLECTPTVAGRSRVWQELQLSSWNELHLPCPNCNEPQVLRWREGQENGDNEGAGRYHFIYELDSAGRVVPGSTRYICIFCKHEIEHAWKRSMMNAGDWKPRYPDRIAYQGFHLSALYSLSESYDWDLCAQSWVGGLKDPAKRKVCINTILALPYEEKAVTTDATGLQARAEEYPAEIPDGVLVLTIAVDVQGDRLEFLVMGFGAGLEWWVIEWGRVEGDPAKQETWDDLGEQLNRDWTDADGVCYGASAIAIDAGYLSTHVKKFCARFTTKDGVRPIHVIGRGGRARPLMEKPGADVRKRRRVRRPSWVLGTDTMNDLLFARLKIEIPGPEYLHFPSNPGRLDPAYYHQLLSEKLITRRDRRGLPERVYVLPPDTRNEGLDLTRLCYGALLSMGVRVVTKLERMSAPPSMTRRRALAPKAPSPPATGAAVDAPVAAVEASAPTEADAPKRRRTVRVGVRRQAGVISEAIE